MLLLGAILMSTKPGVQSGEIPIPRPAGPWGESNRILGSGKEFYSDFCLIEDKLGRWHCIGIGGEDSRDDTLFHAVADKLAGPYHHLPKIVSGKTPAPRHMWAPFAIWKDETTALLYYAHMVEDVGFTERLLTAAAPGLEEWTPYTGGELRDGNIVFEEPSDRDACIFWDDTVGAYLMYYAAHGPLPSQGNEADVIRVRTSKDLIHWDKPVTVIGPPPGYQAAESPFVLKRDGLYYLWVSGFDYGRMSLYASKDPFTFGDPVENRLCEQSGHCPEIVTVDGQDFMAVAAVASKTGGKPGEHDLLGVFLQELVWE